MTAIAVAAMAGCGGPDESLDAGEAPALSQTSQAASILAISSFKLSTQSVAAGGSLVGTVSLNGSAKGTSGGVNVYIGYPRGILSGPRFVRIPNGSRSATFTLYTNPFLAASATATIVANTGSPQASVSLSQPLSVAAANGPGTARPEVASLTLAPATVTSGGTSTGTVTLTRAAPPGGAVVQLGNSNDALNRDADLPPVAIVPEGATSATFTISTHLSSATATYVQLPIVGNYFGGTFQGAYLTIVR